MPARYQEDSDCMRVCSDISHMVNTHDGCVFLVPYSCNDRENIAYKVKVRSIVNCQRVHDWPITDEDHKALAETLLNIENHQCPELNSEPNRFPSENMQELSLADEELTINMSADDIRLVNV